MDSVDEIDTCFTWVTQAQLCDWQADMGCDEFNPYDFVQMTHSLLAMHVVQSVELTCVAGDIAEWSGSTPEGRAPGTVGRLRDMLRRMSSRDRLLYEFVMNAMEDAGLWECGVATELGWLTPRGIAWFASYAEWYKSLGKVSPRERPDITPDDADAEGFKCVDRSIDRDGMFAGDLRETYMTEDESWVIVVMEHFGIKVSTAAVIHDGSEVHHLRDADRRRLMSRCFVAVRHLKAVESA